MTIFSALTSKIFGGLSAALFVTVIGLGLHNASLKRQLKVETEKRITCELKVTISNQSIALLQSTLEGKNRESELRADMLEANRLKLASSNSDNDERFTGTQAQIDKILAQVGQPSENGCITPNLGG